MWRTALMGLWLACVTLSVSSVAAPPLRVAVEAEGAAASVGARLRAELGAMGFDVAPEGQDARTSLPSEVLRVRLRALTEGELGPALELSVAGAGADPLRLQAVLAPSAAAAANSEDDVTLALRAAELVRASLLAPREAIEQRAAAAELPRATPVQDLPPASPASPASPAGERIGNFHVGLAGAGSVGGLGAFAGVDVGAALWLAPRWALGVEALLPLGSMSHRDTPGTSSTRVAWASLMLHHQLPLGDTWVFDAAAGLAGVWLRTSGTSANEAFTDGQSSSLAVAPLLRAGLGYALGSRWRLMGSLGMGWTLPRFLITYGDRTVARWGAPFGHAQIGIEIDLP